MTEWKLADVWECVAEVLPDAPALQHGDRTVSWREFDQRANAVAHSLLAAGLGEQAKVGLYLYNCPEYSETLFACFKAGLVPFNTNYRYGDDELVYLFENADAEAVVFHADFADRVTRIRARLPKVRAWLVVGGGHEDSVSYADVAAMRKDRALAPWGRSPDHLFFLYTGGTTGMPKGVMWRQDDVFVLNNRAATRRYPEEGTLADVRAMLDGPGVVHLCACPLMHGTGGFTSISALCQGGSVVTLEGTRFDPIELLDALDDKRVEQTAIVGDAFARPIVDALAAHPRRWTLDRLRVVISSGVKWSDEVKDALLEHYPQLLLVDTLGASEALGMGRSIKSKRHTGNAGRFSLNPNSVVLRDDGTMLEPGSEEVGFLAQTGRCPVGYYKDPEKTARTFPVIDGVRYTVLGDHATIAADGSITLLGRGSMCINTGGEKVFAEEVENTIRLHPSVADVVVVGVPDPRFGEAVCALVQPRAGELLDRDAIITTVKAHLAGYKAPRHVWAVERVIRGPNGKLDYAAMKAKAVELSA